MAEVDMYAEDLAVIGKEENIDKQAIKILTGKLDFAADHLPGQKLFTRLLLSPHAHANIVSIDTTNADALDGVVAIVTHEDMPPCPGKWKDLWTTKLLFAGAPVAAVAAVDEDIASQAVALIDVEYEVLPFVLEIDDAVKSGAPFAGATGFESNVFTPGNPVERGDLQAGFDEADLVREYQVGQEAYYRIHTMEPHAVLAYWEGDDLYCWYSAQNSHDHRGLIAEYLSIPIHRVHGVNHATGGGYGSKGSTGIPFLYLTAVLARKAGMPVEFHPNSFEEHNLAGHFPSSKLDMKLGAKSDGTLTAAEITVWAEAEWNGDSYYNQKERMFRQSYKCPNAIFQYNGVLLNKTHKTSWRGHSGDGQMTEVAVGQFAAELGMSYQDFQLKNFLTPDMADQDSNRPLTSNSVFEVTEALKQASNFDTKWHEPNTRTLDDGRKHGIGFHTAINNYGGVSSRIGAIINLTRDGKCILNIGLGRAGCGTNTALCHIVAETLGMNYEDVHPSYGETDPAAEGGNQGGSTRVSTLGAAFHMAALDARAELFDLAAAMLEVTPDELDAREGKIFVKADETQYRTHAAVASRATIIGKGYTWAKVLQKPVLDWPVGTACEIRAPNGMCVEVAVDTDTGHVELLSAIMICDTGRTIFYQGCRNQIEGGMGVQYGNALMWEDKLDPVTGFRLSANWTEQKLATSLDYNQDKCQAMIHESIDACGPWGAKGLGEPSVMAWTAYALAIHNAIGIWISDYPINQIKILEALGKA